MGCSGRRAALSGLTALLAAVAISCGSERTSSASPPKGPLGKSSRGLTNATQVKDISPQISNAGTYPQAQPVRMGSKMFFGTSTSATGKEVWVTDGTAEGTHILYDINPGPSDSEPSGLTAVGSTLFFAANAPGAGNELWKSDGTPEGTVMVKDAVPGWYGVGPQSLTAVGNKLFFVGFDQVAGGELWISDGTANGTQLVKDINPGQSNSNPQKLTAAGNLLYFTATDGTAGAELWKSDGTLGGTVLVKDIWTGSPGSNIQNIAPIGNTGKVVFSATDSASGPEIWVSDGTESGTTLLLDISPGGSGSYPGQFAAFNGGVAFVAGNGDTGRELWFTDGTPGGTQMLKDINEGSGDGLGYSVPVVADGMLLFSATSNGTTQQLWKSDGTPGGTVALTNDASGFNAGSITEAPGGAIFFSYDSVTGYELWKTDGTTVALLKDITPGTDSSSPVAPPVAGPGFTLFWTEDGAHGAEPWITDGTLNGTVLLKDLEVNTSSAPEQLIPFTPVAGLGQPGISGELMFFVVDTPDGTEMWTSDGTTNGTTSLSSTVHPAKGPFSKILELSHVLFFFGSDAASGLEPRISDGFSIYLVKQMATGAASAQLAWPFEFGGKAYFAGDTGNGDDEPWVSSGFGPGTIQLADIFAGAGSHPTGFSSNGSAVFFKANGNQVDELWVTDGAVGAGTHRINTTLTSFSNLTGSGSYVFFTSGDSLGTELYKTDGTTVSLVKDINPTGDSSPNALTDCDGVLYFSADDGTNGPELWRSDGTEPGTVMVADIYPGSNGSSPYRFTCHDGRVYFRAVDAESGYELWVTDGTGPNTHRVKDIIAGPVSGLADMDMFSVPGGPLLFVASDGPSGAEVWATLDGTDANTWRVEDIAVGPSSSNPGSFAMLGQQILFAATDENGDRELWTMELSMLNEGPPVVGPPAATVTEPDDGDFVNSQTPALTGTTRANATVEIFIDGASIGTVTADGTGNWSNTPTTPLSEGAHTIKAQATDVNGTGLFSNENGFTVDSFAPSAPVIAAPLAGTVTMDHTPTVSGTAEPGTTVLVFVNGTNTTGTAVGTAAVDGSGNWTMDTSNLPDGVYIINVYAQDGALNLSPVSNQRTITVDSTIPSTPVISAPANGSLTSDRRPLISGTAEADSTVQITLDAGVVASVTAAGDGTWSYQPTSDLADGPHSVVVVSSDTAGNISNPSATNVFTVDATAPVAPAIAAPTEGAVLATTTPTISGTAEPDSTVIITIDGTPYGPFATDGLGAWEYTPTAPLSEGPHAVTVVAKDEATNASPEAGPRNFIVDVTAPLTPAVTAPSNFATTTPTVVGTAEPGSLVTVYLDGSPVGTTTADNAGNFNFVVSTPLSATTHNVKVKASDAADNSSGFSNTLSFLVDVTAPEAPVASGPSGPQTTATPAFSGTAESGSTVKIYVDGVLIGTVVATGEPGSYSFTPTTPLAEGAHTVYTTATDPAGNTGPASTTADIYIDTSGPELPTVEAPSAEAHLPTATPLLQGGAEAGSVVTLVLDGVAITVTADSNGKWSYPVPAALAQGAHTLQIKATDGAENSSPFTELRTFHVDTIVPDTAFEVVPPATDDFLAPTFELSSDEEGVTYECSLDGGDYVPCSPNAPLPELLPGEHNLKVRAVDQAGNKDPTPAEYNWEITLEAAPRLVGGGVKLGCSQSGVAGLLPFAMALVLPVMMRRRRRCSAHRAEPRGRRARYIRKS